MTASPSPSLRALAPGVHVADIPLRFAGVEVGARMTVLSTRAGLILHSPVDMDQEAVAALGEPRWALAPNKLHHLWLRPWVEAGLEAWGPVGLPEKRSNLAFAGVIEPDGRHPFGDEIETLAMRSFPFAKEIAVLHRPSKTLVVADLLFNIPRTAPWTTRLAMRCALAHPGCQSSVLERVAMRRDVARDELRTIASWDFDRIVLAHGDVVETGGKAALLNAYRWLGL